MGLRPFLGGIRPSARMEDGDEWVDLDNLEYASDFGTPTDQSCGEAFVIIQGVSSNRARFRCGSLCDWVCGKAGYADSKANSGLARRRDFARNARGQDTERP